jgi:hypothetical protein
VWADFGRGPIREVLGRRRRYFFLARKEFIYALTNFPLDEAATAGGGLEFGGDSLVPGAPVPEFAYCIHAYIGLGRDLAKVSQYAFKPIKRRILD